MKKIAIVFTVIVITMLSCRVFLNPADPDSDNFRGTKNRFHAGITDIEYEGPSTIPLNTEAAFQIFGTNHEGTRIDVTDETDITFTSTSGGTASVTNSTNFTGSNYGGILATATYVDENNGALSCTFTLNVVDLYRGITADFPPSCGIGIATPVSVTALRYDDTEEDVGNTLSVTFTPAASAVFQHINGNPHITGQTNGSVAAEFTFIDSNNVPYTDTINFTVSSIAYNGPGLLAYQEYTPFQIVYIDDNMNSIDITEEVAFEIDPVSTGGLEFRYFDGSTQLYGTGSGTVNATVEYNDIDGVVHIIPFTVEVAPRISTLTIDAPPQIISGQESPYTVTAEFTDGTTLDVTNIVSLTASPDTSLGIFYDYTNNDYRLRALQANAEVIVSGTYTDNFGTPISGEAAVEVLSYYENIEYTGDTADLLIDTPSSISLEALRRGETTPADISYTITSSNPVVTFDPADCAVVQQSTADPDQYVLLPRVEGSFDMFIEYTDRYGTMYNLTVPVEVTQTSVYVSETHGDDTNGDGTMFNPYKTLQTAINATTDPNIQNIFLAGGTYSAPESPGYFIISEGIQITGGYNDTIQGTIWNHDPANSTTILTASATGMTDGADSDAAATVSIRNISAPDSTGLQYLTIQGPDNSNTHTAGIYIDGSTGVQITHCTVYGGQGTTMSTGILVNGLSSTSNPDIAFSEVYGSQSADSLYSRGIALYGNAPSRIRHNNPVSGGIGTTTTGIYVEITGAATAPDIISNVAVSAGNATAEAYGIQIIECNQDFALTNNNIYIDPGVDDAYGIYLSNAAPTISVSGDGTNGYIGIDPDISPTTDNKMTRTGIETYSPNILTVTGLRIDLSISEENPVPYEAVCIDSISTPLDLNAVDFNSGRGFMTTALSVDNASITVEGGSSLATGVPADTGNSEVIHQEFDNYLISNELVISDTYIFADSSSQTSSTCGIYAIQSNLQLNPGVVIESGNSLIPPVYAIGLSTIDGGTIISGGNTIDNNADRETLINIHAATSGMGIQVQNNVAPYTLSVSTSTINISDSSDTSYGVLTIGSNSTELSIIGSVITSGAATNTGSSSYGLHTSSGNITVASYGTIESSITAGNADQDSCGIWGGASAITLTDATVQSGNSTSGPSYGIYSDTGGSVNVDSSSITAGNGRTVAGIYCEPDPDIFSRTSTWITGDIETNPSSITFGQATGTGSGDDSYGIFAANTDLSVSDTVIRGVYASDQNTYGITSVNYPGDINIQTIQIDIEQSGGTTGNNKYGIFMETPSSGAVSDLTDVAVSLQNATVSDGKMEGIHIDSGTLFFEKTQAGQYGQITIGDNTGTASQGIYAIASQVTIDGIDISTGAAVNGENYGIYSINGLSADSYLHLRNWGMYPTSNISVGDSYSGTYGVYYRPSISSSPVFDSVFISTGDAVAGDCIGLDFTTTSIELRNSSVVIGTGSTETNGISVGANGALTLNNSALHAKGSTSSSATRGLFMNNANSLRVISSRVFTGDANTVSCGIYAAGINAGSNFHIQNSIISTTAQSAAPSTMGIQLLDYAANLNLLVSYSHIESGLAISNSIGIYFNSTLPSGSSIIRSIITTEGNSSINSIGIFEEFPLGSDQQSIGLIEYNNIYGFQYDFHNGSEAININLPDNGNVENTAVNGNFRNINPPDFDKSSIHEWDLIEPTLVITEIKKLTGTPELPSYFDIIGTVRPPTGGHCIGPYEYP